MTELYQLTAAQAAAGIAAGSFSSEELTGAYLQRIAQLDGAIGAFIAIDPDYALAQAREADAWRRSGRPIGSLHGVPVAVKDLIDTADYPTEYGSRYFAGNRPRNDAAVVSRLRAAGAVIIGKTVSTEMAYYHPGKTRNPHDLSRTPGGSSSGSAAAVAAAMAPLALGTQTNGSVIRPASFCGVFGMKPSHGLVPRTGAMLLSRSLDHIGPMARSIEDIALVMDVIAGTDGVDPDTRALGASHFRRIAMEDFGLSPRLAFVKTPMWDKADPETRAAFEALADELGGDCFVYDLPASYAAAWEAHRAVMAAEMAHNLGAHADAGGDLISAQFHAIVAEGRGVSATRYLDALADARAMRDAFGDLFEQACTAIITPAAVGVAPVGEATGDPVFCSLWSLVGLPAVTLPLLTGEGGLPLGVQLVGAMGDDARLLRTANWLVSRLTG